MNIYKRFSPPDNQPSICAGSNQDGFVERIQRIYGVELESANIANSEGIILAIGVEFKEALYRAYYLTILGQTQPGAFIASFPLKYFYKTPIVIQVRSENGDLLTSTNFQVPGNTSKYLK